MAPRGGRAQKVKSRWPMVDGLWPRMAGRCNLLAVTRAAGQLPRAIREDHDPFALGVGFGGGFLFAFLRWSNFRCPHCRSVFRRTYLPSEVRLGRGTCRCSSCGREFDNGSREWPELSQGDRLRYLLPAPVMGMVVGLVVCSALVAITSLEVPGGIHINWGVAWITGLFCAGIAICVDVPRLWRIRQSLKRIHNTDCAQT